MKKSLLLFALLFVSSAFAQNYQRKHYDYNAMEEKASEPCDSSAYASLDTAAYLIDNYQSSLALSITKRLYNNGKNNCWDIYESHAKALFRAGEWEPAVEVIEKGIDKFGPNPELIVRRAYMSIEMGDLGVGERQIDGSSVYVSKDKKLPYNEDSFRVVNYRTALHDFEYLCNTYTGHWREMLITGYLYSQLGDYESSNNYMRKLQDHPDYGTQALIFMADNYTKLNDTKAAEDALLMAEKLKPKLPTVLKKLAKFYNTNGQPGKVDEYDKKAQFYSFVPEFCTLPYTKENFETLTFFYDNNPTKEKFSKLQAYIKNAPKEDAIDMCISILAIHNNHGNGLEEKAVDELVKFGVSAVPKSVLLLQDPKVSTCTITNAAAVLAEVKDPAGWQPMVDYLPNMVNMPITLIPPAVPEMLIKFDKDKGMVALLDIILQIQRSVINNTATDNPLADLNSFSQFAFYYPLKEIKQPILEKEAVKMGYTPDELKVLVDKVYNR